MKMTHKILVATSVLGLAAACGNKDKTGTETVFDPAAREAAKAACAEIGVPNAEHAAMDAATALAFSEKFLAEKVTEGGSTKTESGLLFQSFGPSTGIAPKETDLVRVHYCGRRMDGSVFDSSIARDEPVVFPLSEVIVGWKEGMLLMQEGDWAKFTLPPDLGYGARGTPDGTIGPNQAISFEVELLEVIDPEADEGKARITALSEENFKKMSDKNLAAEEAFLADNGAREGVTTTESGLQYEVLVSGEGDASPTDTDVVTIHIKGAALDGRNVGNTYISGQPVAMAMTEAMPGWSEGLKLMKIGDKYKFFVPSALAMGEQGLENRIGPNEMLTYEIELLKVEDAEAARAAQAKLRAEQEAKMAELRDVNVAAEKAFLAENAKKESVKQTESGLQYEVVTKGEGGAAPVAENQVEVHYRGTLLTGEEFDSSYSRNETATFPLLNVIPGWTEGLQLMEEGDTYRFYIPSELAYGPNGRGGLIGPSAMLVFDIELIEVKGK